MKRIMLWTTAVLLVAGSWIGNMVYYRSMQLEEPLFLKHYMAVDGTAGMIELAYLENRADAGGVTGIRIDELPGLRFDIREDSVYSHHVLKKAMAVWNPDTLGVDTAELPLTVTEATIYYQGEAPRKVPIGEVRVADRERAGLLEGVSSGGSSDGTGRATVRVKQRVMLEKVDYSFSERLGSKFALALSGQPADRLTYPLELEVGDALAFTYEWLPDEAERAAYVNYQIKLLLHFRTEDGQAAVETLPVNRNVYLSEEQVKRLVRSGGELP